jgi:hypothetical protein
LQNLLEGGVRSATWDDESRDEDVRVEDRPHRRR